MMIMIEIQYSSTALLFLVNPCILHHMPHLHILVNVWKEDTSLPAMFNRFTAVQINNCLKRTSAIKVAIMKITDFRYKWKPSRASRNSIK